MKGNCRDCLAYENCPRMAGESYCLSAHPEGTSLTPTNPEVTVNKDRKKKVKKKKTIK